MVIDNTVYRGKYTWLEFNEPIFSRCVSVGVRNNHNYYPLICLQYVRTRMFKKFSERLLFFLLKG